MFKCISLIFTFSLFCGSLSGQSGAYQFLGKIIKCTAQTTLECSPILAVPISFLTTESIYNYMYKNITDENEIKKAKDSFGPVWGVNWALTTFVIAMASINFASNFEHNT